MEDMRINRTHGSDEDFISLVKMLDHELWDELNEDQATYDPHNKVQDVKTALVLYVNNEPVACGCLREFSHGTTEIKRMFVRKDSRRKGLSKKILNELELWAKELGYQETILETSIHFNVAVSLYQSAGYSVIPNYGPYQGLKESICMKKVLKAGLPPAPPKEG